MIKRQLTIIEIVNKEKKVEVTKLAELLNVSQVTIRKDLETLESKGLLKRQHGYAVNISSDNLANRLTFNYEQKKKIAQYASSFVEDGETIIIESGSTCALLAKELASSSKRITIITNSLFIANFIKDADNIRIIVLAGEYQKQSEVVIGPMVRESVQKFYVDKLFVGTDGFKENIGFTNGDYYRAEAVRDMSKSAREVIILTTSEKFSTQGLVQELSVEDVSTVITDVNIPSSKKSFLEKFNIKVHTVDS